MRTVAGSAVSIERARVVARSPDAADLQVELPLYDNLSEAVAADFTPFFPSHLLVEAGKPLVPAHAGVATLPRPLPADLRMDATHGVLAVRGLMPAASRAPSRRLWVDVELQLADRVRIGGICYGGHPLLPYYVNASGESSANFGLPRELRLSWQSRETQFPDDDDALTDQAPATHGGVHILTLGPAVTDRLVIRFADLPRFMLALDYSRARGGALNQADCRAVPTERSGLLIPYLYVFTHEESSQHRAHASMGLLAARVRPRSFAGSYAAPLAACAGHAALVESDSSAVELNLCADTIGVVKGGKFVASSAASILGMRRNYGTPGRPEYELYCSSPLAPNARLTFVLAQSEEQPRCVAAVKLAFRPVPGSVPQPRPDLRVRIYEVDLVEGMSPIDPSLDPAASPYCTCLYDGEVPVAQSDVSCRFVRASMSEHFIVELVNQSSRAGRVGIWSMEFLRSAHVSLAPRAARTRHVRTMHYRLIGAGLADDYARIGSSGFSFAVDLLTAGQRRTRLFAAQSLLELLDSGSARLYANHRRLDPVVDVTVEETRTHAGGYEERSSRTSSNSWQRSETGEGVAWQDTDPRSAPPADGHGFQSFGSSESRAQTEHIGHEGAATIVSQFAEMVNTFTGKTLIVLPNARQEPRLRREDGAPAVPWATAWTGVSGVTYIDAVTQLSIPPFITYNPGETMEVIGKAVRDIAGLVKNGTLPTGPSLDELMTLISTIPVYYIVNGLGLGGSVGFQAAAGVSMSVSSGQLLPHLSYSSTQGLSGAITLQATQTGYSYGQTRHQAGDVSSSRTDHGEGLAKRTSTRHLDQPGSTKQRARGVEIAWQGRTVDIITGTLPINVTFPATADERYDTTDLQLRVQIGEGLGQAVEFDVWFDTEEEMLRRDY